MWAKLHRPGNKSPDKVLQVSKDALDPEGIKLETLYGAKVGMFVL